jgi:hypothetical protein
MPALKRNGVDTDSEGTSRPSSQTWITVVVVIGSILLAGAIVAALISYCRRRDHRGARKKNQSSTHKDFLRRGKMTAVTGEDKAEIQRRIMIRKSLASRSNEWSGRFDNESLDTMNERRESSLKEDWKEWEARMQRERPERSCRHPSTVALPEPPLPTKARSRSRSSSPLLSGQTTRLSQEHPALANPDGRVEMVSLHSISVGLPYRYGSEGIGQAI